MALPTILVNSSTGSDSAASGAGPGTALTGSAASFSAGTVTLDGSPDLTNVATDGSHVLYLVTSSGVRFFKITGKDNGAKTVTVTPNPAGTASGLTWAIGGKRASIGSSSSRLLFDNGGSSGDAMPGWIIELESGYTETLSSTLTAQRAGDTTTGPIVLRGASGGTKPILTFSNNGVAFQANSYHQVRRLEFRNTHATKTASIAVKMADFSQNLLCVDVTVNHATDKFWKGIGADRCYNARLDYCDVQNCADSGLFFRADNHLGIHHCYVRNNGAHGLDSGIALGGLTLIGSVFADNGSYGLNIGGNAGAGYVLAFNTFYSNGSHGVAAALDLVHCVGNIFADNGGYGLYTSSSAAYVRAFSGFIDANCFYNNTSGKYNPSDLESSNEVTVDPQFTNAASGDFSIGTTLKGLGSPISIGRSGLTTSYFDIGAAQRQEAAASAGPVAARTIVQSIGTY